jgi:hypothetical protein
MGILQITMSVLNMTQNWHALGVFQEGLEAERELRREASPHEKWPGVLDQVFS